MKIILLFFTISCGFILNAQQFFGLPTQNTSWIVDVYFTDITYYEPGYSIDFNGNIKCQTNIDVEYINITNIEGKIIHTERIINKSKLIDISFLSNGLYYVFSYDNDHFNIGINKFIKQ